MEEYVLLNKGENNHCEIELARLDGMLRGLTYLHDKPREKFAEAFFIPNIEGRLSAEEAIQEYFKDQMTIRFVEREHLENWLHEVEVRLPNFICSKSSEMDRYISFKLVEMLLSVTDANRELEALYLISEARPNFGNGDRAAKLVHFCFKFPERYMVIHFVDQC